MTSYPRTLTGDEISPRLRSVVATLAEYLINGSTPSHQILLEQYSRAKLRDVELTGAGCLANFEVPDDVKRVQPARLLGGSVSMRRSYRSIAIRSDCRTSAPATLKAVPLYSLQKLGARNSTMFGHRKSLLQNEREV